MKITWFGHSAFRIDIGASAILIDPFLSGNPSFKGDPVAAAEGTTHVLVTHGHDDHVGDAAAIAARTGAQIVSNYEICMVLMEQGAKNINPGNTGGTVPCGEFTVSFTQALHSSGAVREGRSIYLGNPNGLIIRHKDAPAIYHMGDTDMFGDMALIAELYAPKIGMVPVGDRFTMSGASAAFAVKRFFAFDVVFPCHYGTFDLLDATPDAFVKGLAGTKTRVMTPKPGEATIL